MLYASSWTLSDSDSILSIDYGSDDFCVFCESIGTVVNASVLPRQSASMFGNESKDGKFCLHWSGGCESITFHLPHLMQADPIQRKRLIGNDLVHIIFSDSDYNGGFAGISGQFGVVSIIVRPCKQRLYNVEVVVKDSQDVDVKSKLQCLIRQDIINSSSVAPFVRRLAIEADVVCKSIFENAMGNASNWCERLNILFQLQS